MKERERGGSGSSEDAAAASFSFFQHPALIAIAGMYFCVKLIRYSLLFWLPTYMTNRLQYSPADAGYASASFELIGFAGMVTAGVASDKLAKGRRFPVSAVMLALLAAALVFFPSMSAAGFWWNVAGIAMLGFLVMGPDSLMSAAAVQDLAPRDATARVAGIVNGFGSLGQVASPYTVAWVVRFAGWDVLFLGFIAVALLGSLVAASQWRVAPLAVEIPLSPASNADALNGHHPLSEPRTAPVETPALRG